MSVLVAIIGNDFARAHEFTRSAIQLELPEGSNIEMLIGGDWCGARNTLAEACLEGDYTHLWFMDDDHSFAPNLLMQLLAWNVDIVTPMCLTRVWPFTPVSYVEAPPGSPADYMPIDFANYASSGLVKLAAGGCAGMLIKREVLLATRYGTSWDEAGGSRTDGRWFEYGDRSEDIIFCEKAIAAGFTLYGDLGARLGHITTAVAIPHWTEDGWVTRLRMGVYHVDVMNTYDMVGRDEIAVETEEINVEEATPRPLTTRSEPIGWEPQITTPVDPGWPTPATENPMIEPPEEPQLGAALHRALAEEEAERIEIWQAEDAQGRVVWWWRAIDAEGRVLAKDSAHREEQAIPAAIARFPECGPEHGIKVFQIARELDDSRNIQQFGPPRRLWNREPE